jgi:uncharacterized protein YjiS (DUF1127 family)
MVSRESITDVKGNDMLSLMDTFFGRLSTTPSRGTALDRLNAAMALHRSRMQLAALDQHLLEDIGIDRTTAAQEAARPVWDAPSSWRQ